MLLADASNASSASVPSFSSAFVRSCVARFRMAWMTVLRPELLPSHIGPQNSLEYPFVSVYSNVRLHCWQVWIMVIF